MKSLAFLFCCLLFVFTSSLSAQKNIPGSGAQPRLYQKSCEKLSASLQFCVLCQDKALKTGCKEYICDANGKPSDLDLEPSTLREIIAQPDISTIKGIEKTTSKKGNSIYSIRKNGFETYIFKYGSELVIEQLPIDVSEQNGNTPVAKDSQDPRLNKGPRRPGETEEDCEARNECIDEFADCRTIGNVDLSLCTALLIACHKQCKSTTRTSVHVQFNLDEIKAVQGGNNNNNSPSIKKN